jgi:drug/metabolite transporter (DMT)-like permease
MSGSLMGLLAALLFGASTPASKMLLSSLTPFQLAGLLYLGAAIGTFPFALTGNPLGGRRPVGRSNWVRLGGAILFGGCAAPVLLLLALSLTQAGSVALMLNLEVAATAVLGLLIFREHLHIPGLLGIAGIFTAGVLLSRGGGSPGVLAGLAVAAGCVCWGIDNHLTALIDSITPSGTAFFKGSIAGSVNLAIGLSLAPLHTTWTTVAFALCVGALSYGASIVLYIASSHQLGATRAQGLFASAPFVGAVLSFLVLRESIGAVHVWTGAILIVSVVLILRSQHTHVHHHALTEHIHRHKHDDGHHAHDHPELEPAGSHTHPHRHEPVTHSGRHWPDLHHRHDH